MVHSPSINIQAKFIPQVIAYVLKRYAKRGMRIFDPFAGYGTVGVVSRIYGYDYILWDLNPIIKLIHDTSIMSKINVDVVSLMKRIKNSKLRFTPKWSNLKYWVPQEFTPLLSKVWGFTHSLNDESKFILLIPLLRISRYFSYSDEKVHKLYKSKHAKKKVGGLLKKDWEVKFYTLLEKELITLIRKISEYNSLNPKEVKYQIKSGIDILETNLEEDVNILITSPPYLQAQEYIRSTKLELFWLGYDENYINQLSKKEIPYREVNRINIYSKKYFEFRENIKEEHLRILYERYFHSILDAFSRLGRNVKNYMCIFVGHAKIRTIPIPIDEIIIEHLENFGWKHEITLIDKIVSHSMFDSKINPASGLVNNRIKSEHLVVLKRCD